jgi:hypothetical protein
METRRRRVMVQSTRAIIAFRVHHHRLLDGVYLNARSNQNEPPVAIEPNRPIMLVPRFQKPFT